MRKAKEDPDIKALAPNSKLGREALASLADLNPDEIFEVGKAEGRRLELTLIKRWVSNHRLLYGHDYTNLEKKLSQRTKPAKRKEGGR